MQLRTFKFLFEELIKISINKIKFRAIRTITLMVLFLEKLSMKIYENVFRQSTLNLKERILSLML